MMLLQAVNPFFLHPRILIYAEDQATCQSYRLPGMDNSAPLMLRCYAITPITAICAFKDAVPDVIDKRLCIREPCLAGFCTRSGQVP